MVSIIIPSRHDQYLQQTIDDLIAKTESVGYGPKMTKTILEKNQEWLDA